MTPERLEEIRGYFARVPPMGDSYSAAVVNLMAEMARDLLANVDALEAIIRELPSPLPEQILPDPAGALLRMRRLVQARKDFLADRRVLGEP